MRKIANYIDQVESAQESASKPGSDSRHKLFREEMFRARAGAFADLHSRKWLRTPIRRARHPRSQHQEFPMSSSSSRCLQHGYDEGSVPALCCTNYVAVDLDFCCDGRPTLWALRRSAPTSVASCSRRLKFKDRTDVSQGKARPDQEGPRSAA